MSGKSDENKPLDTPFLTASEITAIANIEIDTFMQWQKPNRRVLGDFGKRMSSGRTGYSINDAILLRLTADRLRKGCSPAVSVALAKDFFARLDSKELTFADKTEFPDKRVIRLSQDANDVLWHETSNRWIAELFLKGGVSDSEEIYQLQDVANSVLRNILIRALINFDAIEDPSSLISRMIAVGFRETEIQHRLLLKKAKEHYASSN